VLAKNITKKCFEQGHQGIYRRHSPTEKQSA